MKTYMFYWNGRRRFVDAADRRSADAEFMRRYGFFPEGVEVSEV